MACEPPAGGTLIGAALSYAERGWPVIPLHTVIEGRCTCDLADCKPGKHPRTLHGLNDASTDARAIEAWWRKWPDANIGIAMGGPARLAALDIDGPAGEASLQELKRQHGELPTTLESRTGKGRHLLFTVPEGVNIRPNVGALVGIDIRAQGSYIVAPPSLHVTGRRYQWAADCPIACWPDWLTKLLTVRRAGTPGRGSQRPGGQANRRDVYVRTAAGRPDQRTTSHPAKREAEMTPREELVTLLEERTLSHFERRKRRLQRIPWPVTLSAIRKGWERDQRVTREEWIILHFGWIPEEREQMIRFFESRGYTRCRNCGRGIVSDGPHDRCAACGSAHGEPGSNPGKGK